VEQEVKEDNNAPNHTTGMLDAGGDQCDQDEHNMETTPDAGEIQLTDTGTPVTGETQLLDTGEIPMMDTRVVPDMEEVARHDHGPEKTETDHLTFTGVPPKPPANKPHQPIPKLTKADPITHQSTQNWKPHK